MNEQDLYQTQLYVGLAGLKCCIKPKPDLGRSTLVCANHTHTEKCYCLKVNRARSNLCKVSVLSGVGTLPLGYSSFVDKSNVVCITSNYFWPPSHTYMFKYIYVCD